MPVMGEGSVKLYLISQTATLLSTSTFRYTDGNLDEQLVETMRQFCVRVIEQKGEMSLDAITSLVRSKFTSEQNLSSGHMRQILQTLMYDGLVRVHVMHALYTCFIFVSSSALVYNIAAMRTYFVLGATS